MAQARKFESGPIEDANRIAFLQQIEHRFRHSQTNQSYKFPRMAATVNSETEDELVSL